MARIRVGLAGCLLILLVPPVSGWTQTSGGVSSGTQVSELVRSAGIIFSGRVLRIERLTDVNGEPASVRVKFLVEKALRGCKTGETIDIAEWPGLWVRSDRYRMGQEALILFYPRNAAGLTSPVSGDLGTFVLGPDGLLRLTPQQASLLSQSGGHALDEPSTSQRISRPRTLRNAE